MSRTLADLLEAKAKAEKDHEHYQASALQLLHANAPTDLVIAHRHMQLSCRAEVKLLDKAIEHAKKNGCILLGQPVPATAFGGRRIAWIYTSSRQLFELVEAEARE